MTFDQLKTLFRKEVIADETTSVFDDATILEMLYAASKDIAAMCDFPQKEHTTTVVAGATSLAAPVDMVNIQMSSVSVGVWNLRPGNLEEIKLLKTLSTGIPVKYHYDPRKGGAIQFAPAITGAGSIPVSLEYTKQIDPATLIQAGNAWEGNFAQWHSMIALYAGRNAFRRLEQLERSQYFLGEFRVQFLAFANFLGIPNAENILGELIRRSDSAGVGQRN